MRGWVLKAGRDHKCSSGEAFHFMPRIMEAVGQFEQQKM